MHSDGQKAPYQDCFYCGGCGCNNPRLDVKPNLPAGDRERLDVTFEIKMDINEIRHYLAHNGKLIPAREAEGQVPDTYGLYTILIDDPRNLPSPFSDYMLDRDHTILYLGKASGSFLFKRLVKNDLRHKGHATFFRSLGAVLGHYPQKGSLANKANQDNYRFSDPEKERIVDWINKHLVVRCLALSPAEIAFERQLIADLVPVLNIDGNPGVLQELNELREKCKAIARSEK